MKKKPEKFHKKKTIETTSQKKDNKQKLPGISLRIPEFKNIYRFFLKPAFLMNFLAGFIAVAIILTGMSVKTHHDELQKMRNSRDEVKKEYAYWKSVVSTHDGYRDGYFRLATLAYRLGITGEARIYAKKALVVDPMFLPAKTLNEKIGEEN